jgi:RNA polymerase sigma factor (sigma-70 family)
MMRKDGFPELIEHRIGHNALEPVQQKPDFQIDSSVLEMLPEALRRLDEQERTIIQMRLEGRLLREIGEELGFSKQRAEQVMKRAIANLRGVFRSFGVEEI